MANKILRASPQGLPLSAQPSNLTYLLMKQACIYSAGALLCLALTCCSNKAKADPEPATRMDTTATQAVAPDSVALEEPAAEPFGVRRVKVEKQNKFAEYEAEIDVPG